MSEWSGCVWCVCMCLWAIRRWCLDRGETGRTGSGKSIADYMLEEFIADGGSPEHPDHVRLNEWLQRNTLNMKAK